MFGLHRDIGMDLHIGIGILFRLRARRHQGVTSDPGPMFSGRRVIDIGGACRHIPFRRVIVSRRIYNSLETGPAERVDNRRVCKPGLRHRHDNRVLVVRPCPDGDKFEPTRRFTGSGPVFDLSAYLYGFPGCFVNLA